MEPMLAALKEFPGPAAQPLRPVPPGMTEGLINEVAAQRARRRRRTTYLVAAAAALIVGGPAVAVVATSGGHRHPPERRGATRPTRPRTPFDHMTQKVSATDPTTGTTATVGTEAKAWGTHTVLELKNAKGPLKCSLIAIGKNGEQETVTSWAVPAWGYGIKDSPHAVGPLPAVRARRHRDEPRPDRPLRGPYVRREGTRGRPGVSPGPGRPSRHAVPHRIVA